MHNISSARLAAGFFLSLALLFPHAVLAQKIDYSPADALTADPVANPERGFYKHLEFTFGDKNSTPLSLAGLKKLYEVGDEQSNKRISLILRLYYVGKFRDKPLPPEALQLIRDDLSTLRRAGVKAILRFAYATKKDKDQAEPARVISHISQLREIFEKYEDVIAVVQAGFVGRWGEWNFKSGKDTDYGADFNEAEPLNENRRAVIRELLAAVTKNRAIQLRSHFYKRKYGVTEAEPDFYRIGFYNDALGGPLSTQGILHPAVDCFAPPKGKEEPCSELSAQTRRAPMGGESGNASYITKENKPQEPNENLVWKVVAAEFARNHWSYLHPRRYQEKTVNPAIVETTWAGHFVELNNRLGYRFVLVSADFNQSVSKGGDLAVTVRLKNDGWAAPFNRRNLEIVLRPEGCETKYVCPGELSAAGLAGDTDPRKWLPRDAAPGSVPNAKQPEYTFSGTFKNLPAGSYTLSLRLADPAVEGFFKGNLTACTKDAASCLYDLSTIGRFSIQMANAEGKGFKWEEATGLNQLGKVVVAN